MACPLSQMVGLERGKQMPTDATQWCVYDMAPLAAAEGCDNAHTTPYKSPARCEVARNLQQWLQESCRLWTIIL